MEEQEELKQKSTSNKFFIPFMLALIVLLGIAVYGFVSMQLELAQKNSELASLQAQRAKIESENRLLRRYSEDDYKVDYIEKIARDKLGYALPEERIYYIVPTD